MATTFAVLTPAQTLIVQAHIIASPDLSVFPNTETGNQGLAALLNALAVPNVYGWRSDVTKKMIYWDANDLGGGVAANFDWSLFKAQTPAEVMVFGQEMFGTGTVDFSSQSVRDGIAKIFPANSDQIKHINAIGRRKISRVEKLLQVSGAGTILIPYVLSIAGLIGWSQVQDVRNYNT